MRAIGKALKTIDIAFAALVAPCVASSVASCSNHTSQPAQLNDCTPIGDAGCSSHVIGGGSTGPSDAGVTGDADAASTTTLDCNVGAVALINTMNMSCKTCAAASCCTASMACGADCQALLSAVQSNCMMNDPVCTLQQESMYVPATVTAYQGFAQCVLAQCSASGCPTLQQ